MSTLTTFFTSSCVLCCRDYVPTGLHYCSPSSEPRMRWRTRSSSETLRVLMRNRLRSIANPSTTLTESVDDCSLSSLPLLPSPSPPSPPFHPSSSLSPSLLLLLLLVIISPPPSPPSVLCRTALVCWIRMSTEPASSVWDTNSELIQ